jgi:hypothetical protein
MASSGEDFHLQVCAHAGRTNLGKSRPKERLFVNHEEQMLMKPSKITAGESYNPFLRIDTVHHKDPIRGT